MDPLLLSRKAVFTNFRGSFELWQTIHHPFLLKNLQAFKA
jgi:hypothetical protein